MDIQLKVKEILETGLTQSAVAEKVNCSQATISDLANGKQSTTTIQLGLKIIELHQKVLRQSRSKKLNK
jgi:transcriptional regulator with XRE-family HTH domain